MSIPGNAEQPVRRQDSINFSSAIPLKKRRFPVFQPCSPPREENNSALEDSKNKEESKVQVGGTSASDTKTTGGTSENQLPRGKMNVELSLGPKESVASALVQQQSDVVIGKSEKLDSLLSLAFEEEKLVLRDKKQDSGMDSVSNPVSANRSNWDLNTTMDVWEGSTCSDAFAHGSNIGGLNRTESCRDDKSLLTIDSAAQLGIIRKQRSLDGPASSSSKLFTQQSKMDDSLGLKLAMPHVDTSKERSSLSDNLDFTSGSPNLSSKQVQLHSVNLTVKSEPVDDNSKRDCSIGSCSSSNIESSKLSYVKRESANTHTILQSSISPEKLDDRRSIIKSEVVQERKEETCKSKDAAKLSVGRVMRHQESCASSSTTATPVSLLPQSSSPAGLPPCSELTTSGDFANQSEQSLHSEGFQRNDTPDEPTAIPIGQETDQLRVCKLGISNVVDKDKFELARIDEHTVESYQNVDAAGNAEEKMEVISEQMLEEALASDTESPQHCAVGTVCEKVGTVCEKEDEDYEDGEIREHVAHLAARNAEEKVETINEMLEEESLGSDTEPPENCAVDTVCEDNSLQESDEVAKRVTDEERVTNVTPDEKNDVSEKFDITVQDVHETPKEEVLCDIQADESHGIGVEIGGEATTEVVNENCSGEDNLTFPKVEECLDGQDAAKDFNNSGNKSRIINLSRPSAVAAPSRPSVPSVLAAPFKTKSITNRLLTTRNGKERYSEFDGEMQPRGNRDEFYGGGSNKFGKDQPIRNSRPTFMRGKGRGSGRFGSSRGEWDSNPNFASESSYGQSDYRVIRRKHAPSISDVDLDRNGYCFTQDDNSFGGNRRKTMNNEFPSLRRGSLRRVSSGDRDGPTTRGFQMLNRIPRNMSPRRCSGELDNNQIVRGNRNFSTTALQRKGYPRIRSKSPVRSRTRSPGPWSSPRRRSPNGLPELSQHRSPVLFRMGRIRSPDHNACFHDDMVPRRRGSPSFVARHNNDLRDVDSGREHIHPRSDNSNRREEPGRFFARSNRRADALDSREMGDGNEYLNGPSHTNKYHELHGDGNIDNRRKFIERRGPQRPFRPNYDNGSDGFHFHPNDGPRPFRFCPDADTEFVERNAQEREFVERNAQEREFVERSNAQEREFVERNNVQEREFVERNAQEREFDGRIKHQSVGRRIRNIEEQQEGNYRPVERVWHDDGFTDNRVKRRRF